MCQCPSWISTTSRLLHWCAEFIQSKIWSGEEWVGRRSMESRNQKVCFVFRVQGHLPFLPWCYVPQLNAVLHAVVHKPSSNRNKSMCKYNFYQIRPHQKSTVPWELRVTVLSPSRSIVNCTYLLANTHRYLVKGSHDQNPETWRKLKSRAFQWYKGLLTLSSKALANNGHQIQPIFRVKITECQLESDLKI